MAQIRTASRMAGTLGVALVAGLLAATTAAPAIADQKTEPVTLTDMRGMRFCEFLLIYEDRVEIFNTSASAGCPPEFWAAMDTAKLAQAHGAARAQLNGP